MPERQHTLDDLRARIGRRDLLKAKRYGFSDAQLAHLWRTDPWTVRALRKELDVVPAFKTVDTLMAHGHQVAFHDLYTEGFDPLLPAIEFAKVAPLPPDIASHCQEIAAADGIVIVHPNWWGQPPAILKGWVDRVLRQGMAYEFTDKVDELMQIATLTITKPGGMTTTEALSKDLPMVIVNPLPGQETYNTNFLLKKGVQERVGNASREAGGRILPSDLRNLGQAEHPQPGSLAQGRP